MKLGLCTLQRNMQVLDLLLRIRMDILESCVHSRYLQYHSKFFSNSRLDKWFNSCITVSLYMVLNVYNSHNDNPQTSQLGCMY